MVDFTLHSGDNVTISTPTTIENFVYEGGQIRLTPNIYYYKTGQFLFNPVSGDNPEDKIFNAFISRFALETCSNGKFSAFKLYDIYPNTALFFPCMLFQYSIGESPTTTLFGDKVLLSVDILIEVAFKRDYKVRIDTDIISEKDLAEHLLFSANQIIEDIKFASDYIKIGEIKTRPQIRVPKEPNQTLYGFSLELSVEYLLQDAE